MSEDIFFTRSWDWSNRRLNLKFLQVPSKVQYLLYDAFVTAVAAGSVNNTTSESPVGTGGGVTRTVTDGNSKLSITGGVASLATGGVGAGNPGLWYPSQPRLLGRIVLARIASNSGVQIGPGFGWDSDQVSNIQDSLTFGNSGALNTTINNLSGPRVGTFVDGTYDAAIITRSVGVYIFIKGGTFTYWSWLWQSAAGSAAGYPAVGAGAGSSIATATNIRVPVPTYIPTPLAYDTFTRTDGALGSTETVGPDSQVSPALAWTDQVGTWTVTSNKAQASALTGGIAIATVPTSSADVIIDVVPVAAAGNSGLIARYVDSSNYLIAYTDGTNAKLDKVVAGSTTNLLSGAVTYGATKVVRLILSGTTARLFYNDLAVGGVAAVPASTSGNHGTYTTDITNTQDTFAVWARGTSNEYGWLDGV